MKLKDFILGETAYLGNALMEDGGNRGEIALARKEQGESKVRNDNRAKVYELAKKFHNAISTITGKSWINTGPDSANGYDRQFSTYVLGNPGRLRTSLKEKDALKELIINACDKLGLDNKPESYGSNVLVTFDGDTFEIGSWGKQPNILIQKK